MKNLKAYFPLAVIVFFALMLVGTSAGLRNLRVRNIEKERTAQMQLLLPQAGAFREIAYDGADANIERIYQAQDDYVIETRVDGYVAPIHMRIGVDAQGEICGLQIRDIHETPGLGLRALRDLDFLSQFLGTRGNATVGENVDAISGATVTSKAIAQSVNAASAYVMGVDVSSGATNWGGET